ncbi:response regulator transcription factor [Bacillus sp. SCS-151]|uniref:response regulator transcription factor n=1 Tax=Nanhaiella sioensis TaxID=3115293 RepID=UPI003978717C
MPDILLVDDEQRMLQLLKLYLEPNGYCCKTVRSGQDAINYLVKQKVDLVILDIMMPEMNGWDTAEEIRSFSDVPIIMLTAKEQSSDMVKGLRIGADDYITKPFEETVLLARIEAILRRTSPDNKIEVDGLTWDRSNHQLTYGNESIVLTPKEFDLVGILLVNKNSVLTRESLLEQVWEFDSETEDRTVDSHIRNIREKCKKAGFPINEHLQTVWGIGYKWV